MKTRVWRNNVESDDETIQIHRSDGPAVIYPDGELEFCHHGKFYELHEFFEHITPNDRSKIFYKYPQLVADNYDKMRDGMKNFFKGIRG